MAAARSPTAPGKTAASCSRMDSKPASGRGYEGADRLPIRHPNHARRDDSQLRRIGHRAVTEVRLGDVHVTHVGLAARESPACASALPMQASAAARLTFETLEAALITVGIASSSTPSAPSPQTSLTSAKPARRAPTARDHAHGSSRCCRRRASRLARDGDDVRAWSAASGARWRQALPVAIAATAASARWNSGERRSSSGASRRNRRCVGECAGAGALVARQLVECAQLLRRPQAIVEDRAHPAPLGGVARQAAGPGHRIALERTKQSRVGLAGREGSLPARVERAVEQHRSRRAHGRRGRKPVDRRNAREDAPHTGGLLSP